MSDTTIDRPAGACVLHRPPDEQQHWWPADQGYCTCSSCLDRFRKNLFEVGTRYAKLNPRPGASGQDGTRGAPGFGSRSPASDHVISMRDRRSSPQAKAWIGADGRVHLEAERPPLNAESELEREAVDIAERQNMDPPKPGSSLDELIRFVDRHTDWITRHADVVVDLDRVLRGLLAQLRPATGDKRPAKIGDCPNVLDRGESTEVCGAPLFAPGGSSETISCHSCNRRWERSEWLRLGDLMAAS